MIKYLLALLLMFLFLCGTVIGEDSLIVSHLKHEKRIYVDEDGRIFVAASQPAYLHISTSPDDPSVSFPLPDNMSGEPLQLVEGKNILRNPLMKDIQSQTFEVYADGSTPITQAVFSESVEYSAKNLIYFGPGLSFTLSDSDELSGVQETYLSVNRSEFLPIKDVSLNFNTDSRFQLKYYSVDNVGNIEEIKTSEFTIDVTYPHTEHHVKGIYKGNILSSDASIAITSSDNLSGIKFISYRIDDGKTRKYKKDIPVGELSDGEHTLNFYAEDNVGNLEKEQVYKFYHDSTPPEVVLTIEGDKDITEHTVFVSSSTSYRLSASDNQVGVEDIFYTIGQDPISKYSEQFNLPKESGIHQIKYYSIDRVQNKSREQVNRVYLDLTPPETDYEVSGSVFWNEDTIIVTKETRISLVTSDMESGIRKIKYRINDLEEMVYEEPLSFEDDGTYELNFFAIDRVNNREKSGNLWIRTDNSPKLARAVAPKLKHRKQWIETETSGLTGSTELPFYLRISASPDDTARSYLLDMNSLITKDTQPMHFDRMGENIISVQATSEPVSFRINIDGKAPVSRIEFKEAKKYVSGRNIYYGPGLIINLNANDNFRGIRSGVQNIHFSLDGSEFGVYKKPLDLFSREKVYKLIYNSVDSVGNAEEIHETEFIIDITPPRTKQTISGSFYGNTFSSKTIITLSVSDNLSGTKSTFFNFDDEEQNIYKKSITGISFQNLSTGKHTFNYYSVDNVGNKEEARYFTFYLDHSPPRVVLELLGDKYETAKQKFASKSCRVRLTASEQETGIRSINYQINGGIPELYISAFNLPLTTGNHHVSFSSLDLSGNASRRQIETIYIDLTSPRTILHVEGAEFSNPEQHYISSETDLILNSVDTESGVREILYEIDNRKARKYSEPLQVVSGGLHEIKFWATDRVKNREKRTKLEFFVDNKPPDLDIVYGKSSKIRENGEIVLSEDDMIYISATDDFSGVERIVYRVNDGPEKLYRNPLSDFRSGQRLKLDVAAYDQVYNIRQMSVTIFVE